MPNIKLVYLLFFVPHSIIMISDDSDNGISNWSSLTKNELKEELFSKVLSYLIRDYNLRSNSMYTYQFLRVKKAEKQIVADGINVFFNLEFALTGCRKNGTLKEQLKCPTGVLMENQKPTHTESVKVVVYVPEKLLHNFKEDDLKVTYVN